MQTDRRAILTLVALGRITPSEGERLLLAWNAGRGSLFVQAVCLAAACIVLSAQFVSHPSSIVVSQPIHSLLQAVLNRVLPLLTHLAGGMQ